MNEEASGFRRQPSGGSSQNTGLRLSDQAKLFTLAMTCLPPDA